MGIIGRNLREGTCHWWDIGSLSFFYGGGLRRRGGRDAVGLNSSMLLFFNYDHGCGRVNAPLSLLPGEESMSRKVCDIMYIRNIESNV